VIVLEAMSEFERGRETLHQAGHVLHSGFVGIVVRGLTAAPRVFVGERLLSRKGKVFLMRVDVLLKVSGLRRQFEDFLPRFRCYCEVEIKLSVSGESVSSESGDRRPLDW
jgi:hypothetical protein